MSADELCNTWDVAVIGTGIGGALAGRALAEQGLSVLFLERGDAGPSQYKVDVSVGSLREELNYHTTLGGLSRLYGAALERPEPHNLDHSDERPHPLGGWPVSAQMFAPYFSRAEQLFEVRGGRCQRSHSTADALPTAPSLSQRDQMFVQGLSGTGAHPYRTPVAMRFQPGCAECSGEACPIECKRDAKSVGIAPALRSGNAALICNAEVFRITSNPSDLVTLHLRGAEMGRVINARHAIVSAGAIGSARLLLASRSERWPNGLGNQSGLLGRGLMCHLSELLAVYPGVGFSPCGPKKAISLRDLYYVDGMRLGLVQSLGLDANYWQVKKALEDRLKLSWPAMSSLLAPALKVPAHMASFILRPAAIFAGILEDLPRLDNRVFLRDDDFDKVAIEYELPPELIERREVFRREMQRIFAPWRSLFLNWRPEPNWWHACGTARFGRSPEDSVLDPECRVHGTRNVFVSDASFMPTSMGVNPSLTIAANALRVADAVVASLATQSSSRARR